MARLFDDASTQYLETTTLPLTTLPFTVSCWARSNDSTVDQVAVGLCASSLTNKRTGLIFAGAQAGDPIWAYNDDLQGGVAADGAKSTTGYTANQWTHAVGVFASADTHAYINGSSGGFEGDAWSLSGSVDRFSIGRFSDSTPSAYFSGDIAEVAIWNVALGIAEVAMLAAGVCPLFVRPDALVAYVPLMGRTSPEIDVVSGNGLTVTGATTSDHPRTFKPRIPSRRSLSAVTFLSGAVMAANPAKMPNATIGAQVGGAVLAANPAKMPDATIAPSVPAAVMTANPAKMPDGVITNAQVLSGVEMAATVDVPDGAFAATVPGAAMAADPATMPNAAVAAQVAGASMTASAQMPAGGFGLSVTGVAMTATAAMKDAASLTAAIGGAVMAATARMITMVFPGITTGFIRPPAGLGGFRRSPLGGLGAFRRKPPAGQGSGNMRPPPGA